MKPDKEFLDFLEEVDSIVHVGASTGQERGLYFRHRVLWVEPIPCVFEELERNIRLYPKQKAMQALLDEEPQLRKLGISSNKGESSSFLPLKGHKDLHPKIGYDSYLEIQSTTLDSMLHEDYESLVLDTQGTELLILKGGEKSLPFFKYIKTEAWNFEAYEGCCTASDLKEYLARKGFQLEHEQTYYKGKGCELLFKKQ